MQCRENGQQTCEPIMANLCTNDYALSHRTNEQSHLKAAEDLDKLMAAHEQKLNNVIASNGKVLCGKFLCGKFIRNNQLTVTYWWSRARVSGEAKFIVS